MIEAKTLRFSFDRDEDRILLECVGGDEAVALLLTRRITRRLLRSFADILARSSATVARAPVDLRAEVLALEHLGAVAGAAAATPPAEPVHAGADAGSTTQPALVVRVDVRVLSRRFIVLFHDADGPRVRFVPSRPGFHRLLGILDRLAAAAEWDIHAAAGWLAQVEGAGRPSTGKRAS